MVNRRRRSIGRWLAPVALITCAVAVYAVVDNTLLKDSASPGSHRHAVDDDQDDVGQDREEEQAPSRLHREVRRHAVGDLDQDRRHAHHDQAPEPQTRRGHAPRRPAGQALAVTARDRRAAAALLAVALGLVLAVALARPPSAPAAPPAIRAPAGDPRRAGHRRRRLSAPGAPLAPGGLDHQAHDRAGDPRARQARPGRHHRALPRLAGRVDHRAARRRADDGGRPAARAAAGQRQRRGGHARGARRRLAERLRRAHEPPRPPARADPHPLRQRDRARRPQQPLERRGPGQAHAHPAAQRVLPRGDQPARARPCARAPTRG